MRVFPVGLGCGSLSGAYGPADEKEAARVIHTAIDLGVNFFDTSDKYGWGHNEELIGSALSGKHKSLAIATKFGNVNGRGDRIADGRPEHVKAACEASLKRLRTDIIDLYYQHRIDPQVPIEETVGAMGELVAEGKVRALGLCEVNPDTLRRAHSVHPISAIQSEYSIMYREQAEDVLQTARELDISFVPYAPLGRGLLTGAVKPESLQDGDERLRHPRFAPDNLARNLELVGFLQTIADKHRCTNGQVALAWLLSRGEDIIPIPGTKSIHRLTENTAAAGIHLDEGDLDFLSESFPLGIAAGTRYRTEHMKNMYL